MTLRSLELSVAVDDIFLTEYSLKLEQLRYFRLIVSSGRSSFSLHAKKMKYYGRRFFGIDRSRIVRMCPSDCSY